MNRLHQTKTLTLAASALLVAASCSQPVVATSPHLAKAEATTTSTIASVSTTGVPAEPSSTTTEPEANWSDLLDSEDALDIQTDIDAATFTNEQIRERSAVRTEIRQALALEYEVVERCFADVDACDPKIEFSPLYDGALLEHAITTTTGLQGQGIRIAPPEPDPSTRVISTITFLNDSLTEARGSYCEITADVVTMGGDENRILLTEDIEKQEGEFLLSYSNGAWRMTGIQLQQRTSDADTCY